MSYLLNGFAELCLFLGCFEFFEHVRFGAEFLSNLGDLRDDSTFLVFYKASVIGESADAQAAVLGPASLEKDLAVRSDERNHARWRVRSERRSLAELRCPTGGTPHILLYRYGKRFSFFPAVPTPVVQEPISTCLLQARCALRSYG